MYKFTKFTYVLFVGSKKNYILLHTYGYLYPVELSRNFEKMQFLTVSNIGPAFRLQAYYTWSLDNHTDFTMKMIGILIYYVL
jgi:hypothetical protein